MTTLAQAVAAQPYPDYQDWWPMGQRFLTFMAHAIGETWRAHCRDDQLSAVETYVADYLRLVYNRPPAAELVTRFVQAIELGGIRSGEFDALSYGFYRSAFDALAQAEPKPAALARRRRDFTRAVGRRFFAQLHDTLALDLPPRLRTTTDLDRLEVGIEQVGRFLQEEGYLRDHFAFHFQVDVTHGGRPITQERADLLPRLAQGQAAYALYEMGYPVILPSAVYLYQTVGEAQHHSSRTIEELFARTGHVAYETDDFDPSGYPSDLVVELWEIRPQP